MPALNLISIAIIAIAIGIGPTTGRADVVAVVSAASPVGPLSKNQIADIFLGKTARFPDGRNALPIDQIESSGTRVEFYMKFTGKTAAQLKAHWSKIIFTGRGQPPKAVSDSAEVKKLLAQNPYAIAYLEPKMLDGSVRALLREWAIRTDRARPGSAAGPVRRRRARRARTRLPRRPDARCGTEPQSARPRGHRRD